MLAVYRDAKGHAGFSFRISSVENATVASVKLADIKDGRLFETAWKDEAVPLKPLFDVACAIIQGTMQLRGEDRRLRSTAGRKKLYSTAKVWKPFCVPKYRSISGLKLRGLLCLNNY